MKKVYQKKKSNSNAQEKSDNVAYKENILYEKSPCLKFSAPLLDLSYEDARSLDPLYHQNPLYEEKFGSSHYSLSELDQPRQSLRHSSYGKGSTVQSFLSYGGPVFKKARSFGEHLIKSVQHKDNKDDRNLHKFESFLRLSEACSLCNFDMHPWEPGTLQCSRCSLFLHQSCWDAIHKLFVQQRNFNEIELLNCCSNINHKEYKITKASVPFITKRIEFEQQCPAINDESYVWALQVLLEILNQVKPTRPLSHEDVADTVSKSLKEYYASEGLDLEEYDFIPATVFKHLGDLLKDKKFYRDCLLNISELPMSDVAEQMTFTDYNIYNSIKKEEFHNCYNSKNKEWESSGVLKMNRRFNEVTLFVMTETLEGKTPEKRAKIVTYFIGLAQTLKLLNNFHSLKAILAGLQGNPIFRLKKTWKNVASFSREIYRKLENLMSEQDNSIKYREQWDLRKDRSIPFLGDLVYLSAAFSNDKDSLTLRVDQVVENALSGQNSSSFNLKPILALEDYLEYLRCETYELCYAKSLLIEPKSGPSPTESFKQLKGGEEGYLTLKKKELFLLTEAAEVSRKLISMNLPAVCVLLQLEGACIYKTQFDSGDA